MLPAPTPGIPDRATRLRNAEMLLINARARYEREPTPEHARAVERCEIHYNDLIQGDTAHE